MLKANFGGIIGTDLTTGNHRDNGNKTFHGSGMAVDRGTRLFCVRCLEKGHTCYAREGSDECIFCEDKAPCPVMQRAATEHTRIPTIRGPMLIGEAQPRRGRFGQKLAKQPAKKSPAAVSVHAEKPREFIESPAGRELIRAAAKEMDVNNKGTDRTCSIEDCIIPLKSNNKSGRCKNHQYIPRKKRAAGDAAPQRKAAEKKLQRKTAKPAPPNGRDYDRVAASLVLTETQLDHMFLHWPIEDKIGCVQAWLDRSSD